jgi:hypothetical protein
MEHRTRACLAYIGESVKTKFLAALVIACAGLFAGLFAGVAAPASAAPAPGCAPSFTSIPCTIAVNVGQAPVQLAGGLLQAPSQLAGQTCAGYTVSDGNGGTTPAGSSSCGIPGVFANLAGVGCPPNGDGTNPGDGTCGIPGLPGNFATGANQIATAPQTIAGSLLAAPGQLAASLAAAPGQFATAIQNGGTTP